MFSVSNWIDKSIIKPISSIYYVEVCYVMLLLIFKYYYRLAELSESGDPNGKWIDCVVYLPNYFSGITSHVWHED